MTPPRNVQRRRMLADAAIEILGTRGIHHLSHRAVDETASLPPGTATNYFKSREELLEAVASRIVELQLADMDATTADMTEAVDEPALAALIGRMLHEAATIHRTRLLAMFELLLEATRRPALLAALSGLATSTLGATVAHHRALGLQSSPEQAQALIMLYGGALFSLVTAPPGSVTQENSGSLARCIVAGALSQTPPPPPQPAR